MKHYYYFGYDPQTEPSHFCERCGREIYSDGDICRECLSAEDEIEQED